MKKLENNLACSLQVKGSCRKEDEEVATMLAGTDLVPISQECVRSLLKGAHYSFHETAEADEDTSLFMRRAFSKVLSDEHLTQSNQLCLIMHVPERRRHISEKELEELNSFIFELSRRFSGLSINWGIKANHLVQNMEIFIIASEPEKQNTRNQDIINNLKFSNMNIKSYLSQILSQKELTTTEKIKKLEDKLQDINVQFTSKIEELKQNDRMMTVWFNNLKNDWPKLHQSTNTDGNGYCIIIKIDENAPGVEIGFWHGEDNGEYGYIPYWGVYSGKGNKPTQKQFDLVTNLLKKCGITPIVTNKEKDLANGWIAWNNYNGNNHLKVDEICAAIYSKAKELGYLIE